MQTIYRMTRIIGVVALVVLMIDMATAQCTPPTQRARILAFNGGAGRDTLWFGHHPNATVGIDPALCEAEYPPFPPTEVFETRLVNLAGQTTMGEGVKQDYRRFVSPATIDTHRVRFQPGSEGFPMKFKWDHLQVGNICDSAIFVDEFGGFVVPRTPMHLVDSLVVSNPAIQYLLIFRYGQRTTSVEEINSTIPESFGLNQNYPNPFNPSTTIRFAVQQSALTEVAIYDLLGRKTATLAAQVLSPGTYEVKWNGTNDNGTAVGSGVYFARMTARADNGISFTALRKLVLMK